MRHRFIALMFLAFAVTANGATAIPHIQRGASYEAARARLTHAGFRPVPFSERPSIGICEHDLCRRAPEIYDCGRNDCFFLYMRRADGRFLVVVADAETQRLSSIRWATYEDLDEFTWRREDFPYRTANRADLARIKAAAAAAPRPPPGPPDPIPLCSASQGHQPCWVKPPANYKPPPKTAH